MSTEPLDLDTIRRRLERALEFVSGEAPDGVRDSHKTRRAAYILAVNDAPALIAEIERLRAENAEHRRTIRAYVEATQAGGAA